MSHNVEIEKRVFRIYLLTETEAEGDLAIQWARLAAEKRPEVTLIEALDHIIGHINSGGSVDQIGEP